jgi:hypothetical protein
MDPLAEMYPEDSPYAFGHNNPIRFSDPDGQVAIDGTSQLSEEDTRRKAGGKDFFARGTTTLALEKKVVEKVVEQVVKKVGSFTLGRLLGVVGLLIAPVQNGSGEMNAAFSTLSEAEENAYNDLLVKKQNGTITNQEQRDLQDLTDAKFVSQYGIMPGSNAENPYTYAPRVRARSVQDPKAHNFPYSFDRQLLRTTPIVETDGSSTYLLPGSMNGIDGFFILGVNENSRVIYHRSFEKKYIPRKK